MRRHCPTCRQPIPPRVQVQALLHEVRRWLRAAGLSAVTAPDLVALLYPAPAEPDGWEGLREAVEGYAPAVGSPPKLDPLRLALAFRKLRGETEGEALGPGDGLRLDVEGRSGGRARWRVVGCVPGCRMVGDGSAEHAEGCVPMF